MVAHLKPTPKLNDLPDVDTSGVADDDFFYYDAATGLWKPRKLVDADIPDSICRDAEADSKVSDHAALTTGVHGVGAGYIAETSVENLDLASHVSRHQYTGADEFDFIRRCLAIRRGFICDWQTVDKWTSYTSGSGSTSNEIMKAVLATGSTQNSIACWYTGAVFSGPVSNEFVAFLCNFRGDAPHNGSEVRLWLTRGSTTSPSDTDDHMGFKVIDGNIYATNADGTTEKATDTGVDWGTNQSKKLVMIVSSDENSIYYYVDGDLKATHTTNFPDLWGHKLMLWIKNDGVAANREFWNYGTIVEEY